MGLFEMVVQTKEIKRQWQLMLQDFNRYLVLEKHLAKNSVEAYLRDVDHLLRYAGEHGVRPEAVSLSDLQSLIAELNEMGIAITTQCRLISGWRAFFHMMVIGDMISENPASLLSLPIKPKHLPDVLSDNDVMTIQNTFDLSIPEHFRNYVIIEVLYGCGLRVSELVNLKLSNIYEEEECLQIFGKGSKERWVPINQRALKLLDTYIHQVRSQLQIANSEKNYVFLNRMGRHLTRVRIFQIIKEAVASAGIHKNVSPHSLRHSFATELVEHGADLRAVQEMMGHSSIGTTDIYTHISRQTLRNTIKTYHPHYKSGQETRGHGSKNKDKKV